MSVSLPPPLYAGAPGVGCATLSMVLSALVANTPTLTGTLPLPSPKSNVDTGLPGAFGSNHAMPKPVPARSALQSALWVFQIQPPLRVTVTLPAALIENDMLVLTIPPGGIPSFTVSTGSGESA